ncbi:hypothetical protein Sango_2934000 [Sesamum angolense]|uniref:Uncharacterized protein n=1 Tax=Sesamum angolense TaxID=2727404 RepID=A0AAE1T568_9LAMI|nr:hypothetical protein Sango_2934000 [Sesamum angolense]
MCSSKLDGGLGFRNLEAFNLAILAKQLQRLMTRPEWLVHKVLKAKYFPCNHIFKAQVGVRPSFMWRSIIAAHDLLRNLKLLNKSFRFPQQVLHFARSHLFAYKSACSSVAKKDIAFCFLASPSN